MNCAVKTSTIPNMSTSFPSPLAGYEHNPPLPTTIHRSGKGLAMDPLANSDLKKSIAYETFPAPITSNYLVGGFDAHICFSVTSQNETQYAKQLHDRIRYEFPELRIYTLFEGSAGPFTTGSFEVSLRTPLELGTMVAWLVVNRGPLSVLVHTNTVRYGSESQGSFIWASSLVLGAADPEAKMQVQKIL